MMRVNHLSMIRCLVTAFVLTLAVMIHARVEAESLTGTAPNLTKSPQQIFTEFESSLDRLLNEKVDLQKQLEEKRSEKMLLMKKLDELSSELMASQNIQAQAFESRMKLKDQQIEELGEKNKKLTEDHSVLSERLRTTDDAIRVMEQKSRETEEASRMTIQELTLTLDVVRATLADKNVVLDEARKKSVRLEDELNASEKEKEDLRAQIAAVKDQLKAAQQSVADSVDSAKAFLQEKVDALNESLEKAQANLKKKDESIARIATERDNALEDVKKFQDEKASLQEDLTQSRKMIEELNRKIDERINEARVPLNAQISQLKLKVSEREDEIRRLTVEAKDNQAGMSAVKAENEKLKTSLAQLKANDQKRDDAIDQKVERAVNPLNAKIADLKDLVLQKERLVEDKEQQIGILSAREREIKDKLKAAEKDREALRITITELTGKAQAFPDAVAEARKSLEKEVEKLSNDLLAAKEEIKDKNANIQQLTDQQKKLSLSLKESQGNEALLEKSIDDLKGQIEKARTTAQMQSELLTKPLQNKIASLREDLDNKEAALESLQADNAKMNSELQSALHDRKKIQEDLSAAELSLSQKEASAGVQAAKAREPLERSLAKVQQELQEKIKVLDDQKAAIEQVKKEKALLEADLKEAGQQRDEWQSKVTELQNDLDAQKKTLNGRADDSRRTVQDKLDQTLESLAKATQELKDKNDALAEAEVSKQELQKRLADYQHIQKQHDELRVKAAQLQNDLDAQKKSLNGRADDARQAVEDKLNTALENLDKATKELKDKSSALAQAADAKNALEKRLADLARAKEKSDEEIIALKYRADSFNGTLGEQLKASEQAFQKETAALKAQLKDGQEALKMKEAQIKELKGIQESVDVQIAALNSDQAKLKSQIDALKKENLKLRDDLAGARKPFESQLGVLNKQLSEAAASVKALNKNNIQLQQSLDAAARKRDELEKQLDEVSTKNAELQKNSSIQIAQARLPFEGRMAELSAHIKTLGDKEQERLATIETLKSQTGTLGRELENLTTRKNELEIKLKESTVKLDTVQQNIARQIVAAQASLEAKLQKLEADLSASRDEVKSKDTTIKVLNTKNDELNTTLSKSENLNKDLQADIVELNRKVELSEQNIPTQVTAVRKPLEEKIGQLTNALTEERNQSKTNQERIAGLEKAQNNLTQDLKSALAQKAALESKAKELQLKIESLQSAQSKKEAEIKSSYEENIKNIQHKLDDTNSRLAVKDNAFKELTSRQDALNQQLAELVAEKLKVTQELEKINTQLTASRQETAAKILEAQQPLLTKIDALQSDLKLRVAEIGKVKSENARLSAEVSTLTGERAHLSNDLESAKAALKKERESLVTSIASVRNALDQEIAALKAQLNDKQKSMDESQSKIKELSARNDALAQKIQVAERERAAYQTKAQDAQTALTAAKSSIDEKLAAARKPLDVKIDDLSVQLKNALTAVGELTKSKTVLEGSFKDISANYEKAQRDYAESKTKLKSLQDSVSEQLASSKKPFEAKIADLEVRTKESAATIEQLAKNKAELEASLETLEDKNRKLESSLRESSTLLKSLQASVSSQIAEVQKPLDTKIKELTSQLKDAQTLSDALSKSKSELEDTLKQTTAQRDEYNRGLNKVTDENKSLKASAAAQIAQVRKPLDDKIVAITAQLKDVQSARDQLSKSKAELESALKKVTSDRDALDRDLKKSTQETTVLKASIASQISSAKKPLEATVSELTAQLKAVQSSADDLSKDKAQLEGALKQLNAQHDQLTVDYKNSTEELNTLKESVSIQIAVAKKPLEATINELTAQFKTAQSSADDLSKRKAQLEGSLQQLNAQHDRLTTDYKNSTEELKTLKESVETQIAVAKKPLEEKIDILVKSMGDAQKTVNEKDAQIKALSDKKVSLEKALAETLSAKAQLEKDLAQTRSTLEDTRKNAARETDAVRKPLDEKIASLQKSVDQKDKEIVSLKTQGETLQSELTAAIADLKKNRQEIAALTADLNSQKESVDARVRSAQKELAAQIESLNKAATQQEALMKQKQDAFKSLAAERDALQKERDAIEEERNDFNIAVKSLEVKVKAIPQEVASARRPLEEEIERLKQEVGKSQGMLEVRIKSLETDLDKKTIAFDLVAAEKKDVESELLRIMAERTGIARENEILRLKLKQNIKDSCGIETETLEKPLQDRISELEAQLDGKGKEIEGLKSENARLNEELQQASSQTAQ